MITLGALARLLLSLGIHGPVVTGGPFRSLEGRRLAGKANRACSNRSTPTRWDHSQRIGT
jgi:hypothetical protein